MATAMLSSHSASVLTNASVKRPVNPDTKLPVSFHETSQSPEFWDDESPRTKSVNGLLNGPESTTSSRKPPGGAPRKDGRTARAATRKESKVHAYSLSPRDPLIEKLASDMENLTDQQFYERLQELKVEHQKTLKLCEKAYSQKIAEQPGDNVKDKPFTQPKRNTKQAWHSERASDDSSRSSSTEHPDEETSFTDSQRKKAESQGSLSNSVERVHDMWKNFNVEDYAPPRSKRVDRPASASASNTSNKENSDRGDNTWSPVITIPKPFKMTLRDESKEKKRTKAQEQIEHERLAKLKAEEAECTRKFKASPAPAHIYIPMYDEITERQETKRRMNHNYRAELLRSIEKPFKFYQREEQKKRQKRTEAILHGEKKKKKETFKARPVPKVIEENVMERLAEEEEYRKIRVRMRAEELLRESRLPPSMDAREKTKELNKIRQMARAARDFGISTEPSFRPKITEEVPNFDDAHRRLQKVLAKKRAKKEATVTEPFNLRTSRIVSNKDKIIDDMINDEEVLPETRWPYQSSRTKPSNIGKLSPAVTSEDRIPAMTTASTDLRVSYTRKKLQEETQKELEKLESERKRRQQAKRLKSEVVEKAAANDITYGLKDQTEEKLKRFREEERARQEEYRRNLKEMQERVNERPLLFETVTQKVAREKAERKYNETLARAGVSREAARASSKLDRPSSDVDSDAGSYKATSRNKEKEYLQKSSEATPDVGTRSRSPADLHVRPALSRSASSTKNNSYSQEFSKEDTGLSDGDLTDEESLSDEVLELA